MRASVKEFAGKVVVHVKTLVPFGTAVHEIKLAQLHLSGRQSVVGVGTVVTPVALSLHVVDANGVRVLVVVITLITSVVALVPLRLSTKALIVLTTGTLVVLLVSTIRC